MKISWLFIGVFTGMILISMPVASAENNQLDETRIRELIIQTIRENPKIIMETVNQYVLEQQQKKNLTDRQLDEILSSKRTPDVVRPHNPTQGPENAPVTIIEYSDFQCDQCSKASQTIMDLVSMKPGKIRRVFKNRPLIEGGHEQGLTAAKACMAAALQGKFWEYHDLIFLSAPNIDETEILRSAEELGLDIERFNRDRQSAEIENHIRLDLEDAQELNISSTPTININGLTIKGAAPFHQLMQIVQRLEMAGAE